MGGGGRERDFANQAVCRHPRIEAGPGVFLENETLFHEGENYMAGREKSFHSSIFKILSSPVQLRSFWKIWICADLRVSSLTLMMRDLPAASSLIPTLRGPAQEFSKRVSIQ